MNLLVRNAITLVVCSAASSGALMVPFTGANSAVDKFSSNVAASVVPGQSMPSQGIGNAKPDVASVLDTKTNTLVNKEYFVDDIANNIFWQEEEHALANKQLALNYGVAAFNALGTQSTDFAMQMSGVSKVESSALRGAYAKNSDNQDHNFSFYGSSEASQSTSNGVDTGLTATAKTVYFNEPYVDSAPRNLVGALEVFLKNTDSSAKDAAFSVNARDPVQNSDLDNNVGKENFNWKNVSQNNAHQLASTGVATLRESAAVPEPTMLGLFGVAFIGLAIMHKRTPKAAQ